MPLLGLYVDKDSPFISNSQEPGLPLKVNSRVPSPNDVILCLLPLVNVEVALVIIFFVVSKVPAVALCEFEAITY